MTGSGQLARFWWSSALIIGLLAIEFPVLAQTERDYIRLVGARRVYPYMSPVVEKFGTETRFKFPEIIISNGVAGHRMLCAGLGLSTADIAVLTTSMDDANKTQCIDNKAGTVVELAIGFDTVVAVIPRSDIEMTLSATELFLAMAARIPDPSVGDPDSAVAFVENSYLRWDELNPELPATPLHILMPPRDAFETDLLLNTLFRQGCQSIESIAALETADPEEYRSICNTIRDDGVVEEFTGDGEALKKRMEVIQSGFGASEIDDPALYQFYADQEPPLPLAFTRPHHLLGSPVLKPVPIDEIAPTQFEITQGEYLLKRPVYLRIKADHLSLVPGMRDLIAAFLHEDFIGSGGHLTNQGLTPLLEDERAKLGAKLTSAIQLGIVLAEKEENGEEEAARIPPETVLRDIEQAVWEEAQSSNMIVDLERYTNLFPKGAFFDRAMQRIEEIQGGPQ